MKPLVPLLLFAPLAATTPVSAAELALHAVEATLASCAAADDAGVTVRLDAQSALAFSRFTEEHVGEVVAVYLGDILLTAPVIQAPVTGDMLQITGPFEEISAKDVAKRLEAGAVMRVVVVD